MFGDCGSCQLEDFRNFDIAMSSIMLKMVDENNEVTGCGTPIYVRLLRDDGLAAESVITASEPFMAGPGIWSIEVSLDETFEHSQSLTVDVPESETVLVLVELAGFSE